MALKGTLKDFGIADILQLIGQQTKTGTLQLTNKGEEVVVSFKDGNIVRAEATSRVSKDLIGTMLIRAGLLNEQQLDFALETQKRTLQRLGDILVGQGTITVEKFKDMVQLQTAETLYRLFGWKSGTYAFEQVDVEVDSWLVPLRAESVLMEGFRRVDEWPVVKKKITTYRMTFGRKKELPPAPLAKDTFDDALDDAFAEEKKEVNKGEFQSVGENERRVYGLAIPGRPVQDIIDMSMLGEFETAKALCNLLNLDYLTAVVPAGAEKGDDVENTRTGRALAMVGRVLVTTVMVGALVFLGTRVDFGSFRLGAGSASTFTDPAAQRFASRQQVSRIEAALEVYRLEKGALPEALRDLAELGLLSNDDLHYPWRDDYYYRRTEKNAYVLLPPLR